MPFRSAYDCLWCGRPEEARDPADLGGWSQLCSDCLGKAGENGFLRARLKAALAERSAGIHAVASSVANGGAAPIAVADAQVPAGATPSAPNGGSGPIAPRDAADRANLIAYDEARAAEYDDWYLRRGRYERGPVHDAAWSAELDTVGRWLDELPITGEIVELAAGTGWWSPLLASKGELSCYDAAGAALDRARERLLAHGLRAHLHVRDAWAEPDRQVDALFTGFWLSHVPREELGGFLELVRRWLKPGGTFAFIDSLDDPYSRAEDHDQATGDRATRRLADGRTFEIVKVHRDAGAMRGALARAGFVAAKVSTTGRFFVHGSATA